MMNLEEKKIDDFLFLHLGEDFSSEIMRDEKYRPIKIILDSNNRLSRSGNGAVEATKLAIRLPRYVRIKRSSRKVEIFASPQDEGVFTEEGSEIIAAPIRSRPIVRGRRPGVII